MSFSAEPSSVGAFRCATKTHEKMSGASYYSFLCPECGKHKPTSGRKSRGHKLGYRCAECHKAKSAA